MRVRPGNRLHRTFACSEGADKFGAHSRLRCPSRLGVVRPTSSSSSILQEWSRSTCYGGWRRGLHRDAETYAEMMSLRIKIDSGPAGAGLPTIDLTQPREANCLFRSPALVKYQVPAVVVVAAQGCMSSGPLPC